MRITNVEWLHAQVPSVQADEALRKRYPYPPKFFSLAMVRVSTEDGMAGYGYGWVDPTYVERVVKPTLLGREPFIIEQLIEERRYWAVVEHALWDIIGKVAKQPVYRLLGGHKDRVRAYLTCIWAGKPDQSDVSPQQQAKDAVRYLENGFKGIKIRAWRPKPMGDVEAVKAIRDAVGDEMEIMVDRTAHHPGWVWSHETALKVARALEKHDATWLEEPLDRNDLDGLAELSRAVDIPITGGEAEQGISRFREILEKKALDIIQPDVVGAGGLLIVKKVAAIAEAFHRPCILHGSNGPGLAAPLQIIGAIPNCPRIEVALVYPPLLPREQWEPLKPLFRDDPLFRIKDGYIEIPKKPGLGLEPDEDAIAKHIVK